jgi:ABC-2 type transport system ATP-binding protein
LLLLIEETHRWPLIVVDAPRGIDFASPFMPEPVIRTENLTRNFGAVRAVDALSLEVPKGSVFGFLGPNGSGKTTTIRMLLGLVEPSSGRARVLGFDAAAEADSIRARSGALLEYSGIYERLSGEDNLDLYGRIWKMRTGDRLARIKELLEPFGLWDRRKELAGTWSRGMKQKLALARAMLHRPSLIFLDEPTAGLDPVAAASLREELMALVRREGVTVFLTTHNLTEAERMCARVAVIRQGKLLAEGPPSELRARNGKHRVDVYGRGIDERIMAALRALPDVKSAQSDAGHLVLNMTDEAGMPPIVRMLVEQGAEIEEVIKHRASLEDVFLTLVEEDAHA